MLAEALLRVCRDLGLRVDVPFRLRLDEGQVIEAVARFPDLGAPRGMLVLGAAGDLKGLHEQVVAAGYGYSVLSEPRSEKDYSREGCIAMFADWGWNGALEQRPSWMG